jgi:hypothetical protein
MVGDQRLARELENQRLHQFIRVMKRQATLEDLTQMHNIEIPRDASWI